jgi:hypothetical protein
VRRSSLIVVTAAAVGLAGCGGGKSAHETTTQGGPTSTVIPIAIKDGKPAGGITRASVPKGQTVDLVVQSDVADEVHVHGYDLHKDVEAGGQVQIIFKADITGVFEAELENRKLQILELTVK